MSVEDKVIKILSKILDKDASEIRLDADIINDLGADSLHVMKMMMELETEFDMEIADEEAEKITTVQDAVNYIKNK